MKKTFRPEEARPAGHVFRVPSVARHLRDNKPSRPFLLLTRCGGQDLASLALMTTKRTEGGYGATLYEFADQRARLPLPGQERSYADLCSLIFRQADRLGTSERSHARHMDAVRASLRVALGIGSGLGRGRPGASIRGHLVRLTPRMGALYDFRYGVALTEHGYSAARRLQALVPVVDVRTFLAAGETAEDFEPEPGDVLPPRDQAWVEQLPSSWQRPVIDTVRLASFSECWKASQRRETWLEEQIEHVFAVAVDAATLADIESALSARLCLPP
jgi:hypothetical protein